MTAEPESIASSAPDTRSAWQKVIGRLYPGKHCPLPDAPSTFQDCIRVTTVTQFSFADRLRLLFSGCVVTQSLTATENLVGTTVTRSVVHPAAVSQIVGRGSMCVGGSVERPENG